MDARRVIISPHARERGRKRIPGLDGHRNPTGFMFYEIQHAFEAGRMAKNEPAWLTYGRGPRIKAQKCRGVRRYLWPESRTHAYLLVRDRAPDGNGSSWFVITVLERHREPIGAVA
jgi:hypothetical protein